MVRERRRVDLTRLVVGGGAATTTMTTTLHLVSRPTHIHLHSLTPHLHSLVWCSGKVVLWMPNLATNDMYDPYMVTDDRYDRYDRYITVT